jgi:hypothetical protein
VLFLLVQTRLFPYFGTILFRYSQFQQSMNTQATGTFEVKLSPQALAHSYEDSLLARLSIDKTLHGDLSGITTGEMLSAQTTTKGSAGYVAIERVSGTLHGRTGTFVLMHVGTMNRGEYGLSVVVVPDSGTGELTGLSGTFNIIIENGSHSYTFDYAID